jgi:hypothetical protein
MVGSVSTMPRKPVFLVALYSPKTEVEILLLRSVFEGSGLDFYITTDTSGVVTLTRRHTLLVAEDQLDEARGLLDAFHQRTEGAPVATPPRFWRHPLKRLLSWLRRDRPEASPPHLRLLAGRREPRPPRSGRERPQLRLVRGGRHDEEPRP